MFALRSYSTNVTDILATVLLQDWVLVYQSSANTLRGVDVMRFRAMMTSIGALTVVECL